MRNIEKVYIDDNGYLRDKKDYIVMSHYDYINQDEIELEILLEHQVKA